MTGTNYRGISFRANSHEMFKAKVRCTTRCVVQYLPEKLYQVLYAHLRIL